MQSTATLFLTILKGIDLFCEIPEPSLGELVECLKQEIYEPEASIFEKGDTGTCLYIVFSGRVGVILDGVQVAEIGERQTFGEFSLLNSEPRNASIRALEKCHLIRLDQSDFFRIMGNSIPFMKGIIKILILRLSQQNNELIDTLKKREAFLTQKVEERTHELAQAFEEIALQKSNLEKSYEEILRQKDEIQEKNEQITQSIRYAKNIQNSILVPRNIISSSFSDFCLFFKPKDVVSGDFYWFYHHKTESIDQIIIAAVDCTGHGVPGAFMSMVGNSILNDIIKVRNIFQTDKILGELHRGIRGALNQETTEIRDGMDISICSIDKNHSVLEFSGAMNSLYIINSDELKEIKGDRKSIGGAQLEEERVFLAHKIQIEKGMRFFISSDGYSHQFGGEQRKKYSSKKFKETLWDERNRKLEDFSSLLSKNFEEWKGNHPQMDDVLVIGFSI